MDLICISDTHGMYRDIVVPDGDVLIHAGDITGNGRMKQLEDFNDWLGTLPHKHKVVIAGNHDWCFYHNEKGSREILTNGIYLQDESITIDGVKFYGTPWQPEFYNWAFNLPRGEALKKKWDLIPEDTDVLITHGPALGMLDEVNYTGVGCKELREAVFNIKPKVHVSGHIHESYGTEVVQGITFINASVCTEQYRPINPPICFKL